MTSYTTSATMDSSHLRDLFALAIAQGYLAKNSMPGTQNRELFLKNVWELAEQLVAARPAPK